MTEHDKTIDAAIAAEERALLQSIGEEPPYMQQLMSIFSSGRTAWINVVMLIAQTAMFIAAVWAGWHFFEATDTLIALKWGLSASVLMIMSLMIKLALWPVIHFNRMGERLSRLELLLRD